MNKPPGKSEPTGYPEFAVRAQTIGRYFSPPLATSTFHDFVKKGKIVPLKGIRGFYKLNESLRLLGLREVSELPMEVPSRTAEEIIRLAFNAIDPDVFTAPTWLLVAEVIDGADTYHAELVFALHSDHFAQMRDDREKQAYLQGVLDAASGLEAERQYSAD
jgi:hypothetical protein